MENLFVRDATEDDAGVVAWTVLTALDEAAINRGRKLGYHEFSLLVSVKKTRLKAYYESMGFRESGRIMFFGYEYDILRKTLQN